MRTIKKYANRRLYDTETSAYINLDGLAELIRAGEEIHVVDVKTGADLTREVLLQVIGEVLHGSDLLPVGMLRRVIRATGTDPASVALRAQLGTGLALFSEQLDRMEELIGPFGTTSRGPASWPGNSSPESPPASDPEDDTNADADLVALRDHLAALERRLKR